MFKLIKEFIPLFATVIVFGLLLENNPSNIEGLKTLITFFAAILLEAMPFMLIGSLVSGIIEVFVPRELISRWIPGNRFIAVLLFGLLGIVSPICECGIVPVIRRLLRKGVPLSCGITYMLSAPIVQPIVFVSTLVAFNGSWKVAGLRILGGYLTAITVGMLSIIFLDPRAKEHMIFQEEKTVKDHCCCESHDSVDSCCDHDHHELDGDCISGQHTDNIGRFAKIESALRHAAGDFLSTGSYLIFGAFLAAGMQTFISQDVLGSLGHGTIIGPLVMMAIAFAISLCASADAFVAAAFTQFPIAARMAFLVMGPMVDIKLMAMYNGFLSKKATTFVFGLAAACAFVYAVILHYVGL